MSSLTQPVTAIAPLTPVMLLAGVSTIPFGATPAPNTRSVTGKVIGELGTFTAVIVTVPVCVDTP